MSEESSEERQRAAMAWLAEWRTNAPPDMESLTKEQEEELLGYNEMMPIEPRSDRFGAASGEDAEGG